MVVHQRILYLLLYEKSYGNRNYLQVENTQDRNLGRVVGEVSINLKANSFKRKSVDGYIIKLSKGITKSENVTN